MRYLRLTLFIALAIFCSVNADAQKRKTTKKKKATTTKVQKQKMPAITPVPIEQLHSKAFAGKVGRTVVDFFGNRTTYGDVIQDIYLTRDNNAVIRQMDGVTENYIIEPYMYDNGVLKIADLTYHVIENGAALYLQHMQQNNEDREGKLTSAAPNNFASMIAQRGKYLFGMSEKTEEDLHDAHVCYAIAAEYGNADAKKYMDEYNQKNEKEAAALALCEEGSKYLAQGKKKDAKKVWKRLSKEHSDFAKTSQHPFCVAFR